MSSRSSRAGPSMISGHNHIITGGTFIQQNTRGDGRKAPFDILREAIAHTAFHDSGAVFDRPKCHPRTRLAVLNKIMSWARRADKETWDRYIMWLTGAAGAGKSAIAQSFIELCVDNGLVIASFFFSRSDGARNHAGSIMATLVYQIYQAVPAVQSQILSVIEKDPIILTKGLHHQFTHLVAKPLCRALGSWRVIVVDGLDECLNGDAQKEILQTISSSIREYDLPILFLIASRPEHLMNVVFNSREMDGLFTRLYLDDTFHPDDDIRIFLRDSFDEIKTNHPFNSCIPTSWPTPEAVDSIVEKSSGQFIYAATTVRFVESIRHQPHHQLEKILNLRPLQGDMPFAQLDELYTMILSSVPHSEIGQVLFAISVYSLDVARWHIDLPLYMSLQEEDFKILFCNLGALVSVNMEIVVHEKNGTAYTVTGLNILHKSLHDFLLDATRSKDYYIDSNAYRTQHMASILQYLTQIILHSKETYNPATRGMSAQDLKIIEYLNDPSKNIGPNRDRNLKLKERFWSTPLIWNIGAPDTIRMDNEAYCVRHYFVKNWESCDISDKLMENASSFPMTELTSMFTNHTDDMALFLFSCFLPLVSRLSHLNPERTSIMEARTVDAINGFLLKFIPKYYESDYLSAALCLAYHAGLSQYTPLINGEVEELHNDDSLEHDTLCFLCTILHDFSTYHSYVTNFLDDPTMSGIYAIGEEAYTKATHFFIQRLGELDSATDNEDLEDWESQEEQLLESVKYNANGSYFNFQPPPDHDDQGALFHNLGSIIFFLPLCRKSKFLVDYCKHGRLRRSSLILPKRATLTRQAMQDYLERFGTDS